MEEFNAILAKNRIARMIAILKREKLISNVDVFLEDLKEIEKKTGQGNQPSVEDIFRVNSNTESAYSI